MASRPVSNPRVLLVQMPWARPDLPSIALGILEQICDEINVKHTCFYFNMDVAASIGHGVAEMFADNRALFGLSEHLFAANVFGPESISSDDFLEAFVNSSNLPPPLCDLEWLRALRDERLPELLESMVSRVVAWKPTVVGFSATFNQVFAGLALAARLKRARPELLVICGGACFDGEMGIEYHRALPDVVDHIFMAEAETAFREFLHRLQSGVPTRDIPGVTWWSGEEVNLTAGHPLNDMNSSPMPTYDAYFLEGERIAQEYETPFSVDKLLFESSRGCWWGEKNHCVFCGLNPDLMEYRSKDIDRIIREIIELTSRYRMTRLMATDWIISRKQRGQIFLLLKQLGLDLDLFFETRADLTKEEIALMKEAGVTQIQPGIESFSTSLLQLMRKHTRGIRQIQFLRWCREVGVHPTYNLLAGFPGENPEWYAEMCGLIPRLRHLDPPRVNVIRVELHRFSPLFNRKSDFGINSYDIRADYRFNFPPGLVDLTKVGYFFDFTSRFLGDIDAYVAPLSKEVGRWINAHSGKSSPVYEYQIGRDFLSIIDTRNGRKELSVDNIERDILLLCDEVKSRRELARDLETKHAAAVSDGTLDRAVRKLLEQDLLIEDGELLLTLPISHRARSTEELRAIALGTGASNRNSQVAALVDV